jgi:diaminopimelate epimerase
VDDLENYNVKERSAIRYSELYGKQGSNINFVKKIDANTFRCAPMKEAWKMTLACGTGATAVAIAMNATGTTD